MAQSDVATIGKKCKLCGVVHPASDYPIHSYTKKPKPVCKACDLERNRGYKRKQRENDPEFRARELEKNKVYRERYSEGYRAHQVKKRAKHKSSYFSDLRFRCRNLASSCRTRSVRKGFECEVTGDVIYTLLHAQNFRCAVTGSRLDITESKVYSRNPLAPSIDRKDNDRGYTLDNIQMVAAWYNMLKNEWTDEDVRSFIAVAYKTMFSDG